MGKFAKAKTGEYKDEAAQRFADGFGPCPNLTGKAAAPDASAEDAADAAEMAAHEAREAASEAKEAAKIALVAAEAKEPEGKPKGKQKAD